MKKYYKILLAVAVTAVVALGVVFLVKSLGMKSKREVITSFLVTNKKALTEYTTIRYCRDTIVADTSAPRGIRSLFSAEPDTVALFVFRPTICAGVDLREWREEDFVVRGDTLFVTLPAPKILECYLNHRDIDPVYDPRKWDLDANLERMSESVKRDFKRDVLRHGILQKAGDKAERSLSELLRRLYQMPVVVSCRQPAVNLQTTDI